MRITLPLALSDALPTVARCLRPLATAGMLALMSAAGLFGAPALAQPPTAPVAAPGTADLPPRLAFNRIFTQPIGPQGLSFSPDVLSRQGQRVRLVGYMVAREHVQTGRFMVTPLPVRMSEHADGEADDLPPATVTVLLPPDAAQQPVPHQDGLIELTGRLDIGRHEDDDGRVTWLRLVLDAAAP
jgi:hypothetical protein